MDGLDAQLLMILQDDFPLAEKPYRVIAERLASDERTVFARVQAFAREGVVRRLGPRYSSRRLGLSGTLVAAVVPAERLEAVAAIVCERPEVTHCYERDGASYNLWFTMTTNSASTLAQLVDELCQRTGVAAMHSLPAERVYKLGVRFVPASIQGSATPAARKPHAGTETPVELSELDRRIVAITQPGLPVVEEPYAEVARRLGIETGQLIERLDAMRAAGLVRTMGVVVDGTALGYCGNALVAWRVTSEECDRAGGVFAGFGEVSHCYRRPELADFPYTLYTMVHGRDRADCAEIIRRMEARSGLRERAVLETRREFKKTAVVFAEPDANGV